MNTNIVLALIVVALLMSAGPASKAEERKIALKDTPVAVQQAVAKFIADRAPGAKAGTVEVEEEKGRSIYDVEIASTGGRNYELEINADGKILEVEEEDDDDDDDGDDDDDDDGDDDDDDDDDDGEDDDS